MTKARQPSTHATAKKSKRRYGPLKRESNQTRQLSRSASQPLASAEPMQTEEPVKSNFNNAINDMSEDNLLELSQELQRHIACVMEQIEELTETV
jgi:hypothetical protein